MPNAEELIRLATNSTETAPLVVAHRLAGTSLSPTGRFIEAQSHLERSLALYDPQRHCGLEGRFGQDVGATIHVYLALNSFLLGQSQLAAEHARLAEQTMLASGHSNTICHVRLHLAFLALFAEDEAEVARSATALATIANEHNLGMYVDYLVLLRELPAARPQHGSDRASDEARIDDPIHVRRNG